MEPVSGTPDIVFEASALVEIRRLAMKEGRPPRIRFAVRGGGCDGFSYVFEWFSVPRKGDIEINFEEISVFTDPKSAVALSGTRVSFVSSVSGHGFRFDNPNVRSSCGCGSSFSV